MNGKAELRFEDGQRGLMLAADCQVADLRLVTDETQVALCLSDAADDLGTLELGKRQTDRSVAIMRP